MGYLCAVSTAALIGMFDGYEGINPRVELVDKSTCLTIERAVKKNGFGLDDKYSKDKYFDVYLKFKCVRPKPGNLCSDSMNPLLVDIDKQIAYDDELRAKIKKSSIDRWSAARAAANQ